jgi:hypothetical protein
VRVTTASPSGLALAVQLQALDGHTVNRFVWVFASMLGLVCAAALQARKDPWDLATTTLAVRDCVNAEVAGLKQLSL